MSILAGYDKTLIYNGVTAIWILMTLILNTHTWLYIRDNF